MDDVELSSVARLVGDRSRATMLMALMDGRALTAGELASIAGIGAPAASAHLSKMLDGGVVALAAQGRHRYYRIASADVAHALESLAVVSKARPIQTLRTSSAARALRPARLCYDHIAGQLGVRIHDHLAAIGAIAIGPDGMTLSATGDEWFTRAGVDVGGSRHTRRPLIRTCLDWTERRSHLAGLLPAGLATSFLDQGWLRRRAPGERGLTMTSDGTYALAELLDIEPDQLTA